MLPSPRSSEQHADAVSAVLLNFRLWAGLDDYVNTHLALDEKWSKARSQGDPSARRARQPKAVKEHAISLAEGLTRGLEDLPRGSARALECDVRRAEVLEGIGQVMRIGDATEQAMNEAKQTGASSSAYSCFRGRLKWAVGMVHGLQYGVEGLMAYDTCENPKEVYRSILVLLQQCEQRMERLSAEVLALAEEEEEEEEEEEKDEEDSEEEVDFSLGLPVGLANFLRDVMSGHNSGEAVVGQTAKATPASEEVDEDLLDSVVGEYVEKAIAGLNELFYESHTNSKHVVVHSDDSD